MVAVVVEEDAVENGERRQASCDEGRPPEKHPEWDLDVMIFLVRGKRIIKSSLIMKTSPLLGRS